MKAPDSWGLARRLGGLRRFAIAITVFNILGHTVFGFEQSWAQPLISLATAYACELLLQWMDARAARRPASFLRSPQEFVNCLLPTHITGLAVAMLLYSGNSLAPIMFASAVAIASKATIRLFVDGHARHIFNPSNFGITATLLMFPWVSIAPPYHFTENLPAAGSWILPIIIFVSGTLVNLRFTGRIPTIVGWCSGFVLQAVVRNLVFGTPMIAALSPMTGVAFVLFTFYMITDPATTPYDKRSQFRFGLAVAVTYGFLVSLHIVFGFFFALTIVSAARGLALSIRNLNASPYRGPIPAPSAPASVQKAAST